MTTDPDEALARVRVARARDQQARDSADAARDALREAVRDAHRSGAAVAHIAHAAGVSRQIVYAWTEP